MQKQGIQWFVAAPKDTQKFSPICQIKARRNQARFFPKTLEGRCMGIAAKASVDILANLQHIVRIQPRQRGRRHAAAEPLQMRGQFIPFRHRFGLVAIHIKAVDQHTGDISLAQQIDQNWKAIR